jgi:hypothetical protein
MSIRYLREMAAAGYADGLDRPSTGPLPKPFNPDVLRSRVGASLEKERLRDAVRASLARGSVCATAASPKCALLVRGEESTIKSSGDKRAAHSPFEQGEKDVQRRHPRRTDLKKWQA